MEDIKLELDNIRSRFGEVSNCASNCRRFVVEYDQVLKKLDKCKPCAKRKQLIDVVLNDIQKVELCYKSKEKQDSKVEVNQDINNSMDGTKPKRSKRTRGNQTTTMEFNDFTNTSKFQNPAIITYEVQNTVGITKEIGKFFNDGDGFATFKDGIDKFYNGTNRNGENAEHYAFKYLFRAIKFFHKWALVTERPRQSRFQNHDPLGFDFSRTCYICSQQFLPDSPVDHRMLHYVSQEHWQTLLRLLKERGMGSSQRIVKIIASVQGHDWTKFKASDRVEVERIWASNKKGDKTKAAKKVPLVSLDDLLARSNGTKNAPSQIKCRKSSDMDHKSSKTKNAHSQIKCRKSSDMDHKSSKTKKAPSQIKCGKSKTKNAPSQIKFGKSSDMDHKLSNTNSVRHPTQKSTNKDKVQKSRSERKNGIRSETKELRKYGTNSWTERKDSTNSRRERKDGTKSLKAKSSYRGSTKLGSLRDYWRPDRSYDFHLNDMEVNDKNTPSDDFELAKIPVILDL